MTITLSLSHVRSDREQQCGICGARFVSTEDTGSRVFSMDAPDREPFRAAMCGGCYSKWSHGTTMTVRNGTSSTQA
jgi:hypothetical protein